MIVAGPDEGHTFLLTYQSKGSYKVVGEDHYRDEPEYIGPAHFVEVRAWNLRDAFRKAAELPFETLMAELAEDEQDEPLFTGSD